MRLARGGVFSSWSRVHKALLASTIVICAVVIFTLSRDVLKQIDAMRDTTSDNVQWTLSQLEVEALQYRMALEHARSKSDLGAVRQRFDIFYSRLNTVAKGRNYATLQSDPEQRSDMARSLAFLNATTVKIDSSDEVLLAALPEMVAAANAAYPALRRVSLNGLRQFAVLSDKRRGSVAETLQALAAATLVLIASLAVVSIILARMARRASAAEHQQRDTAAGLKTIISASLDAVLVMDRSGRILEFNGAAEKVFGYSSVEAVGKRFGELIQLDRLSPNLAARFGPLAVHPIVGTGRLEMIARRRSGAIFPVELSVAATLGSGGERLVSFVRDITERKAAEAELIEARDRALAGEKAKADFLAVMSHEMRTPLNGILGNLSLLLDTRLSARQAELVASIEASGRLLLHHANDVLDIAKHDAGRTRIVQEPFRLDRLVGELTDEYAALARQNGNSLEVEWESGPVRAVIGDPVRLKQILLNYISNAIKFTQDGVIRLRVSTEARDNGAPVFEFRVIDQGIGIKAEDLPRVFEEFVTLDSTYSRRADGSGLGLAIARRMAEAMGGEVGVESTYGRGSAFWARVPLKLGTEDAASEAAIPAEGVAQTLTPLDILIVEDNPINREVLKAMLRREGHRTTEADNGQAGVEMAEQRRFDVILTDISMPVMDGLAATRAIRAGSGPSCMAPIIAVTAHAMPDELVAFREAGMSECLTKPIDRERLRTLLARLGGMASTTPTTATAPAAAAPRTVAASAPTRPIGIDCDQFSVLLDSVGDTAGRELLTRFIGDADATLERLLGEASAGEPFAKILADVHRVAGAAGMFGAMGLKRELNRIEREGKAGDELAARRRLREISVLWRDTRRQLLCMASPPQDNPDAAAV